MIWKRSGRLPLVAMAGIAITLSAQAPAPTFEVASIKHAEPGLQGGRVQFFNLLWTPDGTASDVPGCPASFQEMATRLKITLPASGCPSFFTAVQEQLGLRLESQQGPVEVLVIDSVQPLIEN